MPCRLNTDSTLLVNALEVRAVTLTYQSDMLVIRLII